MLKTFEQYEFADLTPSQKSARAAIAGLKLNDVKERIVREKFLSPRETDVAVDEYRKFLFLVSLGTRELAMCSKEVDEVWHSHILFTQDYSRFCKETFGGFLHHLPATDATPVDPEGVYRFRTAYEQVYGPLHPIWGAMSGPLCFLDPPLCEGQPPQCQADCGCKCKSDDDDD